MMNLALFGAAECTGGCPTHAVAALAGAVAVGFVIGYFVGRRGGHRGSGCAQPQQKRREPIRDRDSRPLPARQPIPAGSVEIYVGNLSYDLTEAQLRKEFEAFGTVSTARVVTNKFNDKSKGYGFVVMPNRPEAEAAIAAMSEKDVMGRKMRVNEARNTLKEEA
ncbi:MAG: RNA recognition motif domain-containing protein [Kiritimatiellia bacterium]